MISPLIGVVTLEHAQIHGASFPRFGADRSAE
jgi:hypothetical protein